MDRLLAYTAKLGLRVAWRDLGRWAGVFHSNGLIQLKPSRMNSDTRTTGTPRPTTLASA